MKIELIIDHLGYGGSQEQVVTLATALREREGQIGVTAVTRGGPLAARLEHAGVPLFVAGKRHKGDFGVVRRIARHLEERAPDVAHAVIFTAGLYGRLAARRAGVPVIVKSEHGVDPDKGRLHVGWDRRLLATTQAVVCNCDAVAATVLRRERVPESRCRVIRNGLDASRFARAVPIERAALGLREDRPVALFVGRLSPEKGTRALQAAASLLLARDPWAQVLIVGDGPERARIERGLSAQAPRARCVGFRDDVPGLIATSDVVFLASRTEGLPGVLLEAQAAGKPVVAPDVGGVREAMIDGTTGLVTPPEDPRALAAAVGHLLASPALGDRLGAQGHAHVTTTFGVSRYADEHLALYRELTR